MALVQALPVSAEPHNPGLGGGPRRRHPSSSSPPTTAPPCALDPMGSVSSLIGPRPGLYHDHRAAVEPGARVRRPTPGTSRGLGSGSPLDPLSLQSAAPSSKGPEKESGNYTYLNEVYIGDWNDNHVTRGSPGSDADDAKGSGSNGNMGGPPPKLIPVSGKLEKNMEKTVLRPTAFKPVIPRSRTAMQYLSPRHCANESQSNLNLLSTAHVEGSPSCSEKSSSYSRARGGVCGSVSSHSCQLTDSGRNSLTSLPPYGAGGYSLASGEASAGHLEPVKSGPPVGGHGHTNSDSGRSSSSKSTGSGSMSGRGQPLSDSGSGGRSPGPAEGYEGVVRDLEDKLRERELELQQLRENLDENEVAICQVYEEKQKRLELELEELRQGCATRMQVASQKAQRAQQVLQLQVYQLQTEKKKLQEDFSQLLQEREQLEERCASFEHEKVQLGPRLEESEWEVCQKSGEISLLKQQLKEVQGELAQRVGEVVSLRGQLREARGELADTQVLLQEARGAARTRSLELEVCENELQRRKSEAELLREKVGRLEVEMSRLRDALANQGPGNRQCHVFQGAEERLLAFEGDEAPRQSAADALQNADRARAELAFERQRAERQTGVFEEERRMWQEEKDKVIRYQKELQQNYVQMYRRNRELEQLLQELSRELESREEDEGSGNEINFDEIAATEI
ncbi:leucine zipper putative tumor suppressor 2 homolog [Cyclopterus lumpus]|uniref:Leucine zipper putative tumor suppressor 2 homolog n=1 Tax=Cyclopterus lumpus TaxID=8103 RepID=A0A8C2ZCV5_CYCLU|nr:leucine zipper putative tumor suppressor 2 homolog [Cyclopterus lumpus]XP_034415282.1 leucine zipper putative tumor suppressor 2 homolog [Cyclopterus lumpus]XP_034415283.1 leucine zipper putative tumor suppressor 2 homolog [Cyclopterus lumpus]